MLTKGQKIELVAGAGVLGGLGYYYYTKSRQVTHPSTHVTTATISTVIRTSSASAHTVSRTPQSSVSLTSTTPDHLTTHATIRTVRALTAPIFTVKNVADSQATITWRAVSGATSYKIIVLNMRGSQIIASRVAVTTPHITATWSGLLPSTTYKFTVVACNRNGCSPPRSIGFITTGNPNRAISYSNNPQGGYYDASGGLHIQYQVLKIPTPCQPLVLGTLGGALYAPPILDSQTVSQLRAGTYLVANNTGLPESQFATWSGCRATLWLVTDTHFGDTITLIAGATTQSEAIQALKASGTSFTPKIATNPYGSFGLQGSGNPSKFWIGNPGVLNYRNGLMYLKITPQ